jgi:hypothetical protein
MAFCSSSPPSGAVTLPPTFVATNNGEKDTQFAITFVSTAAPEPRGCASLLPRDAASREVVCFGGASPAAYTCPQSCGVGR